MWCLLVVASCSPATNGTEMDAGVVMDDGGARSDHPGEDRLDRAVMDGDGLDGSARPALVIDTTGLPNGAVGVPYRGEFWCEGAMNIEGLACDLRGAPPGLSRGSCEPRVTATHRRVTCPVTGTPSMRGTFVVTVTASASNASPSTVTASRSITIDGPSAGCVADPSAMILEDFNPDADPMMFRIRTIPNGVHAIRLRPSAAWKTGPNVPTQTSVFYWEGLLAVASNREMSISRCPGDTTPDEETFNVLRGDDAMGGQMYIYALPAGRAPEPSNFPTKRSNGLPGLQSSTAWYINIRQFSCADSDTCRFNFHIWP